ncbi:MAG: Lysozyme [Cypionkella sp.]|uniref:glycoside hydrolase family protein n=1 Tax=Cypionkella sp. TaxID=2811411 RepID=UPI00260D9AD5|nr:peptidoglycan-binding protein [Cypionkella sp.]MDB5658335.1 Lysozyme [Cypionkella sp.]
MQTSAQGIAALELEEGVVLRAYRDSVGVWTIGAGLTAASGVVKPKAGMIITKEQATALLQEALRSSYEPAVQIAMTDVVGSKVTRPNKYEFDAGVSFHWNLGKIKTATWVKLWKTNAARAQIRASLMQWNKAGGKVLPGLTDRRSREADMLLDGKYRAAALPTPVAGFARWGLLLSGAETAAARAGFKVLGYDPGANINAITEAAARKFQGDHGLTVDGILGRATLSTLQRRLDARAKTVAPALAAAATLPAAATGLADQITSLPYSGDASMVGLALWGASLAWRYRDVIAAQINPSLPRVAAILRSF